jgi:hypothetical protein
MMEWTSAELAAAIVQRAHELGYLTSEELLEFSRANNKFKELEELLGGPVFSMSTLSGIACPGASLCKAVAELLSTGRRKLKRGPACEYTCFSASQEVQYNNTYWQRRRNLDRLLAVQDAWLDMAALLFVSIPRRAVGVRWHVAGDVFNFRYLLALVAVAWARPELRFYGYTKSLHFLQRFVRSGRDWPSNFSLVMSIGGLFDEMIPELKEAGFITAKVVMSKAEAIDLSLEIDHNDSLALAGDKDFGLIVHGPQEAGSPAMSAIVELRKQGVFGYGRKSKANA